MHIEDAYSFLLLTATFPEMGTQCGGDYQINPLASWKALMMPPSLMIPST